MFPRRAASPGQLPISVLYDLEHTEVIADDERLLRIEQVQAAVGLTRSAIYRRIRAGAFPQALELNGGVVRWRLSELAPWMEEHGLAAFAPPAIASRPSERFDQPAKQVEKRAASAHARRVGPLAPTAFRQTTPVAEAEITIHAVGRLIGRSPATIRVWMKAGSFPRPVRSSGVEVFLRDDVGLWIANRDAVAGNSAERPKPTLEASASPDVDREEWLSAPQVRAMLGMGYAAFTKRLGAGEIPPAYDLGFGRKRWKRGQIEDWLAGRLPAFAAPEICSQAHAAAVADRRRGSEMEPASPAADVMPSTAAPARRARGTPSMGRQRVLAPPQPAEAMPPAPPLAGAPSATEEALLTVKQVKAMVGLGVTTIYRRIGAGTFPAPCRIGLQVVRWRQSEVIAWIAALSTSP